MANNIVDDQLPLDEEDWAPPPQAVPGKVRIVIEGNPPEADTVRLLASLLLGGAVEGSDQFFRRLQQWQAATANKNSEIYSESPHETDNERLRYALIGLLSKTPELTNSTFSTAIEAADSAYGTVTNWFSPMTNSRLFRPVRRRYDHWASHGATIVERWIDAGRAAEQGSRALVREAATDGTDEAMNEVIGIMAQKPEVRDLITQQSIGFAGQIIATVRVRTAVADTSVESRMHRLFRRH
jgi:hypothetical protein